MVRSVVQPGVAWDYFEAFSPDAPWPRSASGVSVFKIAKSLARYAPEQQVRRMIEDLQRRHISLALEASALTNKGDCGQKVEGYGRPGDVVRSVERIRQLGGDLKYIAMDGPLWSGHAFNGVNSCHTQVSAIALDVAANVTAIKRSFPAVQIGDIEPAGRADPPDWVDQVIAVDQSVPGCNRRASGVSSFRCRVVRSLAATTHDAHSASARGGHQDWRDL